MTADELRAIQAPIKARYRVEPQAALVRMRAEGVLDLERVACRVVSRGDQTLAGLHPAAGGPGGLTCSADMLLESVVACAGVTLCAVATALSVPLRGGRVIAEGVEDFRGTLGVNRETPVGLQSLELRFELETDAPQEQVDKLVQLTERYCVILQTLRSPPAIAVSCSAASADR